MTALGYYSLTLFQIFQKRMFDFFAEIYNGFISALTSYENTVVLEVHIIDIESDTLTYTNPGTKKQSYKGKIPYFGLLMKGCLLF